MSTGVILATVTVIFNTLLRPLAKTHRSGSTGDEPQLCYSTPGFLLVFLASGDRRLRLVEGEWAGLPWMDWHKRDLHFNGCRAPQRLTRCTLKTNHSARCMFTVVLVSCPCVIVVRGLNLPAVYICRGGKPIQGLAVSLERSIISSSDSATVSLWYVKHFCRKRVNKNSRVAKPPISTRRFKWQWSSAKIIINKRRWRRFYTVITPSSAS